MAGQPSEEIEGFLRYVNRRCSTETFSATTDGVDETAILGKELEQAQHAWDVVRDTFQSILPRLGSLYNSNRPFSRLPAEILRIIFQFAGDNGFDYKTNLCITAVCARWRAIALGHPRMWTSLDATHLGKHLLKLYVARSMPLPLDFAYTSLSSNDDAPQWLQTLILEIIHRIRSLTVFLWGPFLNKTIIKNAASLEQIRIIGRYYVTSSLLRSHHAPKLQSLDLTYCRKSWFPGVYTNLTHLRLHNFLRPQPLPTEDITVILRDSPLLESLELSQSTFDARFHRDNYYARVLEEAHRTQECFSMKRLRCVKLAIDVSLCIRILAAMELPQDIKTISVVAYFGHVGQGVCARTLFSARYLQGFQLSSWRTMKVYDGGDRLTVAGYRDLPGRNGRIGDGVLSVSCQFLYGVHHEQFEIFQCIVDVLCVEHTFPLLDNVTFYSANEERKRHPDNPEQRCISEDVAALLYHLPSTTTLTLRFETLGQCGKILRGLREHLLPSSLPSLARCTVTTRTHRRLDREFARDLDSLVDFLKALCLSRQVETLRFSNTSIRIPSGSLEPLADKFIHEILRLSISDCCLPANALVIVDEPRRPNVRKYNFLLAERMKLDGISGRELLRSTDTTD